MLGKAMSDIFEKVIFYLAFCWSNKYSQTSAIILVLANFQEAEEDIIIN